MGSSGSKAAQQSARRYPTRAPGSAVPPRPSPPPMGRTTAAAAPTRAPASFTKDDAIRADAIDPGRVDLAFAARLRQMGIAQPNPTYSPSSTASPRPDEPIAAVPGPSFPSSANNTTLGALDARRQLQERADREFEALGRSTGQGREFLDIASIRKVLLLRQQGAKSSDIETQMKLKKGILDRLGPIGVVEATGHTPENDMQAPGPR